LDFFKHHYAYVIADVPGSDWTVLDALGGATGIVVVGNQELSTVRGTARIAQLMRQCYGNNHVQVVVSRFDSASRIAQEDVEKAVGGRVRHVIPSDYRRALEAVNSGRPLVLENHNKLSGSLVSFAQSLAGVTPRKAEESPKKPSLLGRLTGAR
jgi:pilus assembly protein CpaE